MKLMDFFGWQDVGGVNSWLFTTSTTRPDGKRRDFMVRLWVGIGISTRWCIPLLRRKAAMLSLAGVQAVIEFQDQQYLMDTGNLLAVPSLLLQHPRRRLSSDEQLLAESCIEFMLRGY
jgi:hypothetical protein